MGQEQSCVIELDGVARRGKALLEHDRLVLRGTLRVAIPFNEIRGADAEAGTLTIRFGDRVAHLHLGAAAEKWARAIREPKSLLDKLGVKRDHRVLLVNLADDAFMALLGARCEDISIGRPRRNGDLIFYGAQKASDLDRLERLRHLLKPSGALWVIRPKGRREITEAQVMAAGKRAGLVDVKVVSFSPTHTAEKFVIPVADRVW